MKTTLLVVSLLIVPMLLWAQPVEPANINIITSGSGILLVDADGKAFLGDIKLKESYPIVIVDLKKFRTVPTKFGGNIFIEEGDLFIKGDKGRLVFVSDTECRVYFPKHHLELLMVVDPPKKRLKMKRVKM